MNQAPFTAQEIEAIRAALLAWGRDHFQNYPWRSEKDPWLTFATEFLLQRTKADQVAAVYPAFKKRFPTVRAFVDGGDMAVDWLASRLGLRSRCRFLWEAAVAIETRGGHPPEDVDELMQMRGVGQYIASAWLSLHRNQRALIADANVARWLSRMTGLPYNRDPRGKKWVYQLCEDLTPEDAFKAFNYAVLDFTMTVCVPKQPLCTPCVLQGLCNFGKKS
ncbi:hypothetical protein [Acanthopleuribacter pedis]|uniref:HhH-GPD domain-containing protein n=1 Tax=Acanthopleuribacter pedis TaxID=442870 RepID=A0A8J7Q6C1_9BACT|nr:hypothetical protein [Acanthopleuribacter pedis]MBO1317494.1 hypothetical protein [Acanthopleuribacter pedis]